MLSGHLASLFVELQAGDMLCFKKQKKGLLKNDMHGLLLASTCMGTHLHLHTHRTERLQIDSFTTTYWVRMGEHKLKRQ